MLTERLLEDDINDLAERNFLNFIFTLDQQKLQVSGSLAMRAISPE